MCIQTKESILLNTNKYESIGIITAKTKIQAMQQFSACFIKTENIYKRDPFTQHTKQKLVKTPMLHIFAI
jgi:hypothetical protein